MPKAGNRVVAAFDSARADDRALLIGYWPAGYPDLPSSVEIMKAMIAGGVDMIEVGIQYGFIFEQDLPEAEKQGNRKYYLEHAAEPYIGAGGLQLKEVGDDE